MVKESNAMFINFALTLTSKSNSRHSPHNYNNYKCLKERECTLKSFSSCESIVHPLTNYERQMTRENDSCMHMHCRMKWMARANHVTRTYVQTKPFCFLKKDIDIVLSAISSITDLYQSRVVVYGCTWTLLN